MKVTSDERGVTLIETTVAVFIAVVGVFSLGSVILTATAANKNQGTEKTRAVVYAQDKMEKLLSLDFTNCTAPVASQPSSCNTTGITDAGWTTGLLAGGPISSTQVTGPPTATNCPSAAGASVGYMDFLDASGIQIPAPPAGGPCSGAATNLAYIREWSIADLNSFTGGPALKQITVAVYSQLGVNAEGGKPIVLITSVISNPN